jgi:hypothetical protein
MRHIWPTPDCANLAATGRVARLLRQVADAAVTESVAGDGQRTVEADTEQPHVALGPSDRAFS